MEIKKTLNYFFPLLAGILFTVFPQKTFALNSTPSNNLTVSLNVTVTDLDHGKYDFQYEVVNGPNSSQSVCNIDVVLLGDSSGKCVEKVAGPPNSFGGVSNSETDFGVATIHWIVDTGISQNYNADTESPNSLGPGQRKGGYHFRGRVLPAIGNFYAEGWVRPMTEDEILGYFNQKTGNNFSSLDEIPQAILSADPIFRPLPERVFKSSTVVPENISNISSDPKAQLSRLLKLQEDAVSLGWIDLGRTAKELRRDLKDAIESLSRKRSREVIANLRNYIRRLEREKGGDVSQAAYYLLSVNGNFILSTFFDGKDDHHRGHGH